MNKEEILKALDAATPGPWEDYGPADAKQIYAAGNDSQWLAQLWYKSEEAMPNAANNAHLIAHAPTWLRSLLEENERITKENQEEHAMYKRNFAVMESTNQQLREELEQMKNQRDMATTEWGASLDTSQSLIETIEAMRAELAAKDKVLKHLADSFATYEGTCARKILSQYKEAEPSET